MNTSVRTVRSSSQYNINDFYLTKLMSLRSEKQAELAPKPKLMLSPTMSTSKKTTDQKASEALVAAQAESRRDNKFFNRLVGAMREFYGGRPTFLSLFHKLDAAFEMQAKLMDSVACYKPELGVMMESSVKDLYQCCLELLTATKKEIDHASSVNQLKLKVNTEKMNQLEVQRSSLETLLSNYEHLLWAKNTEVERF